MNLIKSLISKRKLIAVVISLAVIFTVGMTPYVGKALSQFEQQIAIISEVYQLVASYHVSGVDKDDLMKGAIDGMLGTLDDPYTNYFTKDEYEEFTNTLNSNFTGIGIYIDEKDGYLVVQSLVSHSPAEEAGILSGDLITEVDGIDIFGIPSEQVINLIKGEEGSQVTLTVKRQNQTKQIQVTRKKIQLPTLESEMVAPHIGYIRLYQFGQTSGIEVKERLQALKDNGMEKLILDLRGNPGGYLNAALDISKLFIEEGPIVYVKDKGGDLQAVAISGGDEWEKPIAVLIDEGSASASEILSGALKDYDKATIIGTNSFGKGTVQQLIPLQSEGYLKLTIEEYLTPHKNKVNKVGIKPDIEVTSPSIQLEKAIEFLGGPKKYSLKKGEGFETINGIDYIALRPVAEAYSRKIDWKPGIGVTLDHKGIQLVIKKEDIKLINHNAYLPIDAITDYINELQFKIENDLLTLF